MRQKNPQTHIPGMPTKYVVHINLVIRRIKFKRTCKFSFWVHSIYIYMCFIG